MGALLNTEKSINENNLVTKSNRLIEAAYKLTEIEQKIILTLISLVEPGDTKFRSFTFPIKDFTKLIGTKSEKRYKELEEITANLMSKVHQIRFEDGLTQVQWLTMAKYNYKQGTITLTLNEFLEPYLLDLKKEFTSYQLKNVSKLKGHYSIRIYELLRQYLNMRKKERTFFLDDLREKLGCVNIYPAYANFKQRVIVPAQKQINKKSDITFEFEEIKKGRSVNKIKFIINPKDSIIHPLPFPDSDEIIQGKDKEDVVDVEEIAADLFAVLEEEDIKEIHKQALELGFKVSKKIIKNWLEFGKDNVIKVMDSIRGNKRVENPIGFISYKLKNGPDEKEFVHLNPAEEAFQEFINEKKPKSRRSEILPHWFLKDDAIQTFSKFMSKEEAERLWLEKYPEIMEKLNEIRERLPD
ncbi:replication initiation protein [Bacillus sp. REN16]|uniref:replication initiation protein n=1 Tax=Bacillus sp. REN16 TaxID=2887296 RepID=UPI001E485EDA|nr:replication initiation protein [Bacillus sp. REN16]MCC3358976.1 replication initiation protein [Bacillus sp. REN16]